MKKNKIAFLDRDGVINNNLINNGYIGKVSDFKSGLSINDCPSKFFHGYRPDASPVITVKIFISNKMTKQLHEMKNSIKARLEFSLNKPSNQKVSKCQCF